MSLPRYLSVSFAKSSDHSDAGGLGVVDAASVVAVAVVDKVVDMEAEGFGTQVRDTVHLSIAPLLLPLWQATEMPSSIR